MRRDEAWCKKMKLTVSHLPDEKREAREACFEEISRVWYEGEKKKEIRDARCSACNKKTVSDPDNPIIICDGCVGGALHFRCTKFPLKAIPGEDEDVSSSSPVTSRIL